MPHMGIKVVSNVFQEAMEELLLDMEEVIIYIDNILIISMGSFEEPLVTVEEVLIKLEENGTQLMPRSARGQDPRLNILSF